MVGLDTGRAAGSAIAVFAAILTILLSADAAMASCGKGSRVDHRDAECLSANWNNRGVLRKSPYHVRNMCPDYGRVVAKVDLRSAMDRTLHLDDGDWRDGSTVHSIRGISCCSDSGDLCNRSDVLNDEGCLARFLQASSAAATCENATARYSGERGTCTIAAECLWADPDRVVHPYKHTRILVPFPDLDEVQNCYGRFKPGPCNGPLPGGTTLTVSDARVREARGAFLTFEFTLNQTYPETLHVAYRTRDGTARDDLDYRSTGGVLTIWSGQTTRTVSVRVLDDELDEGPETMKLEATLMRPWTVRLVNANATGTIVNTDRMPKAWIARFGRTVADQVLDALDARMRAKPAPGAEARLAGQRIGLGPLFGAGPGRDGASGEARTGEPEVARPWGEGGPALRDIGARPGPSGSRQADVGRVLLSGSSFSMTAETAGRGLVSVWGRGAVTRFAGRDGDLSVDGEVATGLLGADWTSGRWTTGLLVTHSLGDGSYRGADTSAVTSTLTGVWPWVRHTLDERLSVWGVAGLGGGRLTLEPRDADGARAGAIRTGLALRMAAAGLRGIAVDGGNNGLTLAVKADAAVVRMESDAVSGAGAMAGAEAETTRLRLGLEGSRPFRLGDGSVLTPGMEIAVRRDGGDAETGFGAEVGAGLAWSDPQRGLGAELSGRALLTHEAKGFRRHGFGGRFSWDPAADGRGPRLSLTRTLGYPGRAGAGTPFARGALAAPAANEPGIGFREPRLEARFGYGLPAFGDSFTSTPEIAVGLSESGRDYILGWRLMRGDDAPDGSALEIALEAQRRESPSGRGTPPEHAVGVRVISLF